MRSDESLRASSAFAPSAPRDGAGAGKSPTAAHPATWVPTAYIAEGIPFAVVMWVAGTMFKDFGRGDDQITVTIATIGIAWSLKPLWAPFLDMYRTKRFWVLSMQLALAAFLAALSLSMQVPDRFGLIVAVLTLLAFASATQDICVDGVYITSLDDDAQAWWAGLQGTFWNAGRMVAVSGIGWLAGALKTAGHDAREAWTCAFAACAGVLFALSLYHYFTLPAGSAPQRPGKASEVVAGVVQNFVAFGKKPGILGMLLFVLLYRTGEGLLLVEAPLFLQASPSAGGLGLTLQEKAFVDGTMSTIAVVVGGMLGGFVIAKAGLKRTLVPLAISMNVPHVCYVILSQAVTPGRPLSIHFVWLLVSIEKLGYSFGFVGNMVYMMQQIAPGKHKMTHYAISTALMNLVLVPTQMASGPLALRLGYKSYFLFVLIASIPSVIAAWMAPFPHGQGSPASEPS